MDHSFMPGDEWAVKMVAGRAELIILFQVEDVSKFIWLNQGVLMPDRARDWFEQAQRDLEQAKSSKREGRHEWACFAAQQAAEL